MSPLTRVFFPWSVTPASFQMPTPISRAMMASTSMISIKVNAARRAPRFGESWVFIGKGGCCIMSVRQPRRWRRPGRWLRAAAGSRPARPPGEDRPAAAREPDNVIVVERNDDELHITLNRPHARNAYSTAMRDGLYEALQVLQVDQSLLRAVISGQGSCFCIGGDLNEFGRVSDPSTAHAVRSTRSVGQLLLELSSRLEFRLHSACIGAGIELPAFGARVVAHKNAFMQLPEITLGLLPGAGGTVSILARIGRQRTAYLALSARRISASTALEWGLIDAIT